MVKKALISVSDKSGLDKLLQELSQQDYEFISTGGTAKYIKEQGFAVKEVADLTGFPEMMDGRVKTLHPKVHAGILANRENPKHLEDAESQEIDMIDLVIVNLYPFFETVKKCAGAQLNGSVAKSHSDKAKYQEIIENIDVGGPTMLRSAAKNHNSVTVVSKVDQYEALIEELKNNNGETSLKFRKQLAGDVFSELSHYDALIANYLSVGEEDSDSDESERALNLPLEFKQKLRYGENPHQKASLFVDPYEGDTGIANAEQLQGKELSFNNLLDANAAWNIVCEYDDSIPCVSIIKHTNPCGVAIAPGVAQAFTEALSCDTVSAFGGIVASNKTVDLAAANEMTQLFLEAVIAPDYSPEALEIFKAKKNLRVLKVKPSHRRGLDVKKISGGYIVQDADDFLFNKDDLKVVTKTQIDEQAWVDLVFAWKVVKHVKSNAIVVVKEAKTIGIGGGQTSRVKAVEDAVKNIDLDTRGAVLASDAFFPFADSIHLAAQHHISLIIQPGGSVRDQEVIDACDEHGIAMAFTGCRHFKH